MPSKPINKFEMLGAKLKAYRCDVNLTQDELGEKLGYSGGQYVYYVETGKATIPRTKLKKWLKLIDVSFADYVIMEQECQARETCEILGIPYKNFYKQKKKTV